MATLAQVRSSIPDKYNEKLQWYLEREKEIPMLEEMASKIKGDPTKEYRYKELCKKIKEIQEGMEEFMIKSMPFIKKYYQQEPIQEEKEEDAMEKQTSKLQSFFKREVDDNRGELYKQYMRDVENEYTFENMPKTTNQAFEMLCNECQVPFIIDSVESALICPKCGMNESFLDTSSSKCLTYDQEQTSTSIVSFAYKRSNHLSEHLACFQGKETTNIPKEVIDALRAELKKQRIIDSKKVTTTKVKELLKKLKLQKYYEHTQMITYELNGIKPPTIDSNTEETFKLLFNEIQPVFDRVCPKNRKNFLSYSYVLCKLSELLNRDDLVPFFPLLKSREKLYQQDLIWKDICKELRYEFIPSV